MFSFNVVSLWVLPGYPGPCPDRFFLLFAFLHSQNRYLLSFVHLAPSFSYMSWRWEWLFDSGRHMRIYVEATSARVTISNKSPVRTLIVNVQMNDWKRKIGEMDFWPFLEAGLGRTIRLLDGCISILFIEHACGLKDSGVALKQTQEPYSLN